MGKGITNQYMTMIKNLSGQEFADFDAWKVWAEGYKDEFELVSNVNPMVLDFLTFYPWIITEHEDGAQASEEFGNKLYEQDGTYSSEALLEYFRCEDLEPLDYQWYEYFYNFHAMKLLPNGDGTHTLVNVDFKASKNLCIPESVSRIEYNALNAGSFVTITFPKNFTSTLPFYISFSTGYSWSPALVYTRHPLNIEYDKEKSDHFKNGYYTDLRYDTFRRLCSVWPSAFEGECPFFEDLGYLSEGGELRRISNDSVYAAYSATNVLQSHEISYPSSKVSGKVPLDECKVVAMEILPKKYEDKFGTDIITVPESVEVLFVRRELKELIILGNPKHVYLDVVPGKIKVNAKITEVRSKALKDLYGECGCGHMRVVFNLPDLCEEESINAGYMRVTAAEIGRREGCDRVVEINADHIVLMTPEEVFYRDRPVTGTRIHLAWNGNEQSFLTVLAYEPIDMIAEKINKAKA